MGTVYRLTIAVTIRDQFTGVTLAARHGFSRVWPGRLPQPVRFICLIRASLRRLGTRVQFSPSAGRKAFVKHPDGIKIDAVVFPGKDRP